MSEPTLEVLTPTQREVVVGLLRGESQQQIGARINRTGPAVAMRLVGARQRLGLSKAPRSDHRELFAWAVRCGYITYALPEAQR